MALPTSGSLSIKTAAGAGRSIAQEVDGNVTGNKSLTTLSVTAGKTPSHSMLEFRGYATVPPQPPTSVSGSYDPVFGFVHVSWVHSHLGGKPFRFEVHRKINNEDWTFHSYEPGTATTLLTPAHWGTGLYYFRIRSENSAGVSGWRESSSIPVV